MKKNNFGRLAAAGLAALTAAGMAAIPASAITADSSGVVTGSIYSVTTTTVINGVTQPSKTTYYTTLEAASAAAPSGVTPQTVNVNTFGNGVTVYVDSNGVISTSTAGLAAGYKAYKTASSSSSSSSSSGNVTYGSASYYVGNYYYNGYWHTANVYKYNGLYYPSYAAAQAAGGTSSTITSAGTATANNYFSQDTGKFYANYSDAVNASTHGGASAVISSSGYYYENGYYYGYYNSGIGTTVSIYKVGEYYYPTYSLALAASKDTGKDIIPSGSATTSYYFSKDTGAFYPTYKSALDASTKSGADAVVNTTGYYGTYYYNDPYYYNGYYYNGYYYPYYYNGYYYADPYYYYFLDKNSSNKNNNKNNSSSSSSSKDTTTAAVGNRKGWTNVANYLTGMRNNAKVTVEMNNETTIPASVLKAIKGNAVQVKFVLDNGVAFTINGKSVTTAKDICINTAYNTSRVPDKLVRAAYNKNKAVGTAQLTIDNGSFGTSANVTVKLSASRAGYRAKLYRYDAIKNQLKLVTTGTIQEDGKCTFTGVTAGGNFVIAIF